jgi:hypothetical protein
MRINGTPELSIVSFTNDAVDMHQVGERMRARGWLPGLLKKPKSMHLMLSLIHEGARDRYLADLRACADEVRRGAAAEAKGVNVTY